MIKYKNHRRPFIMANKKREVYNPKTMTEGKRNLIQGLLQEYNIRKRLISGEIVIYPFMTHNDSK